MFKSTVRKFGTAFAYIRGMHTFSPSHARERDEATACGCRERRALSDAMHLRDAREAARLMLAHLVRIETQREFTPPASDVRDRAQLLGV